MQRGRACKGGSEVGHGNRSLPTAVFRVVRARSAWGEEPEKVSRPLLAACRRATLRVQGAPGRVFGSKGRRRAAWNPAWAPRPSGHGMRPIGGCWAPAGIDDDVVAGTEAGSRVAAPRHESGRTAFPCRLRPICARDRGRRDGSPHGTATVLRDTSVERRRRADVEPRREVGAHRAHRCRVRCREAGEGPGPAARVPGACRPAGPARRRGDSGPEVDK